VAGNRLLKPPRAVLVEIMKRGFHCQRSSPMSKLGRDPVAPSPCTLPEHYRCCQCLNPQPCLCSSWPRLPGSLGPSQWPATMSQVNVSDDESG